MVNGVWYFPDGALEIFQVVIDIFIIVPYVVILLAVLYAKRNFPLFEKKGILLPFLGFAILGILSAFMDGFDEIFWFTEPELFYEEVWKPIRMGLNIIGIALLLVTFTQFYKYSFRFIDKEQE